MRKKDFQTSNPQLDLERKLTKGELKDRERIAQDLPDKEFKKRYGKDWKSVKLATATKLAKKEGMYPPYKADQVQKVRYQASDTFTNSPKQAKKRGYSEAQAGTGEIYVYGTLRNSSNLVRIRLQDIKTSSSLNIVSKSSAIEPTRNYEQFPLNAYSNNFDCSEEVITIIFEEHININYLLVIPTNKSTSNQVKTLSITAYS